MNIISAAGGMWEMAITTFVINLRYMLMSLSLSHKIGKMSLAATFGITDSTPAITFPFMLGLIAIPYIGWTLGTVLGAFINNLLPTSLADAMGITFAMFIAIVSLRQENGFSAYRRSYIELRSVFRTSFYIIGLGCYHNGSVGIGIRCDVLSAQ